jgi:hypothetical protein
MTITLEQGNFSKSSSTSKKHELIPDFLIIGAGKSGTTSLDKYLKQHPQIFIPKVKEPNFYGYEHNTARDFENDPEELEHFQGSITELEPYLDLFKDASPTQLKGETSNTYMYHTEAPSRIKYYNPDVKLIAILRQPAGRLYSRFLHLARENRLPTENFSDCMIKDTIWWRRNDLIKEGFYFKNLSPFYQLFPHENIRIYLYEELNDHPEKVLRDIFRFLNVNPDFKPDFTIRYNQSGIIKNKFLNKIYGPDGILSTGLKAILPKRIVDNLKQNSFIQKNLNDLRVKNLDKPKLDPKIRQWLTHEVYGKDIKQLQSLIGKDLSHWLTVKH